MASKYDPLTRYLANLATGIEEATFSFSQISSILGFALPGSAQKHPAWWANQTNTEVRPQAKAWTDAGFLTDGVTLGENGRVRFRRREKTVPPLRKTASNSLLPTVKPRSTSDTSAAQQISGHLSTVLYSPGSIFLVSCVAKKAAIPGRARDLYASTWFKKALAHVESTGCSWYVLSAKYGLVHPDQVIEPYELTLNTMPVRERRAWSTQVFEKINQEEPHAKDFVILAGMKYREFLLPLLQGRGAIVQVPMEGITLFKQGQWFNTHQAYVTAK